MLPAASVAVARKVVVESSGTETPRPGDSNSAALPLAARLGALQSAAVGAS